MKCLKHTKTGLIERVDNATARQKTSTTAWQYVPKAEWKKATRTVTERQEVEISREEKAHTKKDAKRVKK